MVGGTTPPQSDSGEISRVLVLNLLWQSKRCSRTAQDISVLTTPSLLSRGTRQSTWFKILNREYSQKDGREELFERERHSEPVAGWHVCALACEALRWEKQTFYCPISSLLLQIGLL